MTIGKRHSAKHNVDPEILLPLPEKIFTPTAGRTLWRILQTYEKGQDIPNDAWEAKRTEALVTWDPPPPETCIGIQSLILDMLAPSHLEYCNRAGQYVDIYGHWHAGGCSDTDMFGVVVKHEQLQNTKVYPALQFFLGGGGRYVTRERKGAKNEERKV